MAQLQYVAPVSGVILPQSGAQIRLNKLPEETSYATSFVLKES